MTTDQKIIKNKVGLLKRSHFLLSIQVVGGKLLFLRTFCLRMSAGVNKPLAMEKQDTEGAVSRSE